MRIVIVSDFGEVNGGAARVAVTSARGLAQAGIPVIFVCAISPLSPLLDHPLITVRCLEFDNVWNRGNAFAAATQGIWFQQAREVLDGILAAMPQHETIVHFHQWTKAFSPSVLAVPARRHLPSIVSLHDYFLVCPNGAYYRYAEGKPCNVAPMSVSCITARCDRHSTAHKAVRLLRQSATSRATAAAGVSLSILNVSPFAAHIVDRFIPAEHSRYIVPSPVEVEQAPPVSVAENANFLFVGRLTEEKGVRLLAETARDAGLGLTIAGDGPLLKELQQLRSPVNCTGWLAGNELAGIMDRTRALVFPSTWYETGGLVVLEALARGLPAIVSRNTAAAAWIEDGVNGYVVDPGDGSQLRSAMLRLTDDALASRMGAQAYRRYWADPQTLEIHTQRLLAVYRDVLAKHEARRRSVYPATLTEAIA